MIGLNLKQKQKIIHFKVYVHQLYAMKMGFEDSLNIIITDKAHELLLEHGGVVELVARTNYTSFKCTS